METYAIVQQHTPIPLNADFLDYLYKSLMNPKTEYEEICSLTKLLRNLGSIEFEQEEVRAVTNQIIFTKQIKSIKSLTDLYEFFEAVRESFGEVPPRVCQQVRDILVGEIRNKTIPVAWAVEATTFLLQNS